MTISIEPGASESARETVTARLFTATTGTAPTEDQKSAVVMLRSAAVDFGVAIQMLVPEGRNKSIALTALEDVLMRANRGVFAEANA